MNRQRLYLITCTAFAGAMLAAQEPPPAPPVPQAAPAPVPAPAPRPPHAPLPPPALADLDNDIREMVRAQRESMRVHIDIDDIRERARADAEGARDQAEAIRDQVDAMRAGLTAGISAKIAGGVLGGVAGGIMGGIGVFQPKPAAYRRHDSDDRAYQRGQHALDSRNWDEAIQAFTQVANNAGSRADGALYWKAYALSRLGRRDEALAAIAELRKSYASSRWLDDAKALELEVKQASGQNVVPESENEQDLKLMALNGLVQSDPERAMPLLENLLKNSNSPKLKERTLFVLAQSNSPRGKQLLEQVARGGAGNPDLQLKAISYVSAMGKKTDNKQLLWEIYSGSNDPQVKRAILNGLMMARDKEHLLQIAKTEKSEQLRLDAIYMLGSSGGQPELWQIYQSETSPEVKQQILHSMISGGSTDRLLEIAKTEKDTKLRRTAIQALASMGGARSGDTLVSLYGPESDPAVKKSIVDGLHSQRNAKGLVDLARKETDPTMKKEIVSRLSNMKSKEATDYLMELLK